MNAPPHRAATRSQDRDVCQALSGLCAILALRQGSNVSAEQRAQRYFQAGDPRHRARYERKIMAFL